VVFGSITLIKGFKATTWKITTLITEAYKSFPDQVTMRLHKDAIFTTWQAACAVCPPESLLVQVILQREVAGAYSAVHPARSNKFFTHIL